MSRPALLVRTPHLNGEDSRLTEFQDRLLPGVSRTFALTIPQLPRPLRISVTNAYLLCRIADTVEDDSTIHSSEKARLQVLLLDAIRGDTDAHEFTSHCLAQLGDRALAAERELIAHTPEVLSIMHGFGTSRRNAIERCLSIMCAGMTEFAQRRSLDGLADMRELDHYCYVVAGCVGEMLTELFCAYSPDVAAQKSKMMPLARLFGQGLQMTNILKDVWDDRKEEACWLPRDIFEQRGLDVGNLPACRQQAEFASCIDWLVGVTHGHLHSALHYTQYLPSEEHGMRNFCLWAIGLAMLTLRKIHNRPTFASGEEVKISRRALRGVIATSTALGKSNRALSLAFSFSAYGLPRFDSRSLRPSVTGARSASSQAN